MRFWAAWQFLTIIPAPRRREFVTQELGKSVAFFPVIGLVLGLVLLGLDRLMALFLPSFLINILLVAALAILTGALHLDGFIDTCDGLAAKKSTQARLKVMGD
ncbi:MAG: adenosylcobinamide-GDP ribazoletransferase, partial [Dehalococcoidia bacterium]|nr:adenosylcobinamide-GDP ribazoletransferase [Dehalococcoidia bacterium]